MKQNSPGGVTLYSVGCEAYGCRKIQPQPCKGRNYEQLLLQFRPFRAVCLLCIYIALTDYAMQFCPFRALRAGTVFDLLSYKQLSLLDKRESCL